MKNMTIGKRIIIGFSAILIVVLGLGGFTYQLLIEIKGDSTKITEDCLPGMAVIGDIFSVAHENYVLTLKGVLTENAQEKASFAALTQTNAARINQLTNDYNATITMAKDRELFGEMTGARSLYVTAFKDVAALSNAGKNKEAIDLIHASLQPAYDKFESSIAALVNFNKENGHEAGLAIQADVSHSIWGILIGVTCSLLLGIGVASWIIWTTNRVLRQTTSALADGADQVAAASAQVAAASQTLAEGASEQAAALEETSASLEEMTSMVKRNAEAAGKAKVIATETRTAADIGSADMAEMKSAMSEIKTSSTEVAKIVKDIDEIAFQTNILALNAAVEAARAGDAGAGFAVVADEVRNLAQRSAASAKQTAAKIEDAIAKSERGVQISAKVAVSFEQIATKTREVDNYVAEIASASNEQAQGVSQVNIAISQMDKVTQSNAATAEESAAAAEELNAQAAAGKESVRMLQQLVGGGAIQLAPAGTPRGGAAARSPQSAKPEARAHTLAALKGGHAAAKGNREELPLPAGKDFQDF